MVESGSDFFIFSGAGEKTRILNRGYAPVQQYLMYFFLEGNQGSGGVPYKDHYNYNQVSFCINCQHMYIK